MFAEMSNFEWFAISFAVLAVITSAASALFAWVVLRQAERDDDETMRKFQMYIESLNKEIIRSAMAARNSGPSVELPRQVKRRWSKLAGAS